MIRNLARGQQAFTSNVFLVPGDRTVLVDVGNEFDVVAAVEEHVDDIDAVAVTHTHYDHVENLDSVVEAFDVPVYGYDTEQDGIEHAIADDETIRLGDHAYRALHTPGHKNDHLCFYSDEAGVLFAGDLVFANGSFGRTDLDEGDRDLLVDSIERVLSIVDEGLREMHTGHGPSVTDAPYQDIELALQAAKF
ncbi:Glyoxylase, beta-lactamase superfamily II [Haloarcula vallismortis]|uniref:Beta-lactamase domain-containing protein n=2 Tax=Haloarcula vallismortis TaxID=28442 RepID=M0JPT7_HALVA|nr:MBL fold metallo-hydrolase [Haloarcula vallismortis]EMA10393.1 beta-lactamase domain-containing protein [Haloarcula vallismortis ATCC 29715]SDW91763.1 Glyoxylase, beta-lactamase superfamily II [Haloarcula vallismortis]